MLSKKNAKIKCHTTYPDGGTVEMSAITKDRSLKEVIKKLRDNILSLSL